MERELLSGKGVFTFPVEKELLRGKELPVGSELPSGKRAFEWEGSLLVVREIPSGKGVFTFPMGKELFSGK